VAELIASALASITMGISPWVPSCLSLASLVLSLVLLWWMPQPAKSKEYSIRVNNSEELPTQTRIVEAAAHTTLPPKKSLAEDIIAAVSVPNVLLVVPIFLVGIFRYTTLDVLIQYASNRFDLKISTGAIFYTETAAINIALFLFVVPQVTDYLRKHYKVRPLFMDLVLVRTSAILMCIGSLSIGLAPSGKLLPLGMKLLCR